MTQQKQQFHGSDLEKVEAVYGIPKEEIISFGANVNPLGLSRQVKQALSDRLDVITSYPDRDYTALRTAIASYCGADKDNIMVGNGSTELISLFIQCRHPKHAVILAPTYSEYERELALCGGRCSYYYVKPEQEFCLNLQELEQSLTEDTQLLILCNPNNPTSGLIPCSQMETLVRMCAARNIFVLVDETYIEFTPNVSDSTAIPLTSQYPGLAILRGVSKFFAAPGLRLGYAVTGDQELLAYIRDNKNPWTINSIADLAGQLMFSDTAYIEETRSLVQRERIRIYQRLQQTEGLRVFYPYANFFLVRIEHDTLNADLLFDAAMKQGMMLRNCAGFPSLDARYFRFCIMLPEQNEKLLAFLENFIKKA